MLGDVCLGGAVPGVVGVSVPVAVCVCHCVGGGVCSCRCACEQVYLGVMLCPGGVPLSDGCHPLLYLGWLLWREGAVCGRGLGVWCVGSLFVAVGVVVAVSDAVSLCPGMSSVALCAVSVYLWICVARWLAGLPAVSGG